MITLLVFRYTNGGSLYEIVDWLAVIIESTCCSIINEINPRFN